MRLVASVFKQIGRRAVARDLHRDPKVPLSNLPAVIWASTLQSSLCADAHHVDGRSRRWPPRRLILGYHVLQRNSVARLALAVLAVPLFLARPVLPAASWPVVVPAQRRHAVGPALPILVPTVLAARRISPTTRRRTRGIAPLQLAGSRPQSTATCLERLPPLRGITREPVPPAPGHRRPASPSPFRSHGSAATSAIFVRSGHGAADLSSVTWSSVARWHWSRS